MTDITNFVARHACANCGADASVIRNVACCDNPVILNGATEMTDKDMLAGLVKPFIWSETSYGTPEAYTLAGVYRIKDATDGGYNVVRGKDVLHDVDGRRNFPTIEAAKSAAQADYTARVLAALDLDVIRTLVGAAYEAAARIVPDEKRFTPTAYEVEINLRPLKADIRALTPADAQAALDAIREEARSAGRKEEYEARVERVSAIMDWNQKYGKDGE